MQNNTTTKHLKKTKMTSKEKAIELYHRYADEFNFDDTYRGYKEQSKQCALIAIDEILNNCYTVMKPFWQEVKQELEKL